MVNIILSRLQRRSPDGAHRQRRARKEYMKSDQFAMDFDRVSTTFASVVETVEPLPARRGQVGPSGTCE